MYVSDSAVRASKEAETASMVVGRVSEAAGRAWGIWESLRGRLEGGRERGAGKIMKMNATK